MATVRTRAKKAKFYDVVARKTVSTEVVGKTTYKTSTGNKVYAFKGTGKAGNSLTLFVTKDAYDSADVKVIRAKKACKK